MDIYPGNDGGKGHKKVNKIYESRRLEWEWFLCAEIKCQVEMEVPVTYECNRLLCEDELHILLKASPKDVVRSF